VLGHEPDLELVGTNDVADEDIVGTVVAVFGGLPGHGARFLEDEFVGFEEARWFIPETPAIMSDAALSSVQAEPASAPQTSPA